MAVERSPQNNRVGEAKWYCEMMMRAKKAEREVSAGLKSQSAILRCNKRKGSNRDRLSLRLLHSF
jgi:hypothetical protein